MAHLQQKSVSSSAPWRGKETSSNCFSLIVCSTSHLQNCFISCSMFAIIGPTSSIALSRCGMLHP